MSDALGPGSHCKEDLIGQGPIRVGVGVTSESKTVGRGVSGGEGTSETVARGACGLEWPHRRRPSGGAGGSRRRGRRAETGEHPHERTYRAELFSGSPILPVTFSFANVISIMPTPPKPPKPPISPHMLAELIALRPYIEHILCDGSRDPCVRAAVNDSVQTVLRKAIQHLPTYEPHENGLRPWVARIAYNEKIDAFRREQRQEETFGHNHIAADFAPSASPSPERDAQVQALLDKVFAVIEEMPSEMADVLILAAFAEDPHEEIAAQLGIKKGAAKMRLSRARQCKALASHDGPGNNRLRTFQTERR